MVWDGETYRQYNSLNQLSKIYNGTDNSTLLQTFTYHPLEERVLVKTTYNPDSSVKETVYYFSQEYVRVVNSSGSFDTEYVYLNGDLVAEHDLWSDEKRFISTDHLRSSTVITDENGDVIENTSYDPYGSIISGGEASRFNYEGKEFDPLTGDTDFHFRQYQADYGFFTQPDTLIPDVYDPQQLNRYMFERGNPYKYVDEDGHIIGIIVGVVIIAIVFVAAWKWALGVDANKDKPLGHPDRIDNHIEGAKDLATPLTEGMGGVSEVDDIAKIALDSKGLLDMEDELSEEDDEETDPQTTYVTVTMKNSQQQADQQSLSYERTPIKTESSSSSSSSSRGGRGSLLSRAIRVLSPNYESRDNGHGRKIWAPKSWWD